MKYLQIYFRVFFSRTVWLSPFLWIMILACAHGVFMNENRSWWLAGRAVLTILGIALFMNALAMAVAFIHPNLKGSK